MLRFTAFAQHDRRKILTLPARPASNPSIRSVAALSWSACGDAEDSPVDVWNKGQTDGIGHQFLPELGAKVLVGHDEGVFLELVWRLAHFAGDIDVRIGVELLDKFQLVLVQVVEYQLRVVKQNSGCISLRLLVCLCFFTIIVIFAQMGRGVKKDSCVGTQTARLRLKAPGATQTVRTCEKLGYRLFVSVLRVE